MHYADEQVEHPIANRLSFQRYLDWT